MSELALQHERVIAARSRLGFPTPPVKRIPRAMLNKPRAVRPAPPPPEVEKPVKRLVAEPMSPRAPQWVRIVHEVAIKHNIDVASLLNDGRFLHIVKARNEAFWRMRNEIKINGQRMSFPMIGEKFGKDHTYTAFPLIGLGDSLVQLGHAKEGIAYLEHALAIRTKANALPGLLAEIHHTLADAAIHAGDTKRARAEARQAIALFGEAHRDDQIANVRTLMAKHGL